MHDEAEPREGWDWLSGGFDEGTLAASSSPLCSPLLPLSSTPSRHGFLLSVAHAGLALLPVLLRAGVTGWHRHGHLRFHSHSLSLSLPIFLFPWKSKELCLGYSSSDL